MTKTQTQVSLSDPTFLFHFQCSFFPRFSIHIRTKYENNNGSTENVKIIDLSFPFRSRRVAVIGLYQKSTFFPPEKKKSKPFHCRVFIGGNDWWHEPRYSLSLSLSLSLSSLSLSLLSLSLSHLPTRKYVRHCGAFRQTID